MFSAKITMSYPERCAVRTQMSWHAHGRHIGYSVWLQAGPLNLVLVYRKSHEAAFSPHGTLL